ncbi:hypothetical protein I6F48_04740 [Pseudoalteromonas sp. SWYJ118]|uniref:hypothetical protein n=1 Tax=unclassified Pseudoalteromonas TaxID=194690 RepID=UPI0018CFEBDD|nr:MULTISPECIES: hypothetical protein [unclassified Pseudoalteromonas]MBH0011804.1 hypothetical protein [Pseudoalteromonas sp. NZS100_1]MBH0074872.1 hypothetical protein [Pseudoalteromonas sp. SWYJ118]
MHPRKCRHRPTSKLNTTFINQVVEELRADPSKVSIIQENLEQYRAQTHLKRGFLLAIERFDWVFEASKDIDFICQQILADDYIGNRLRRYPLLFKGVINNA